MKCMHCLESFHPERVQDLIGSDAEGDWVVRSYKCPACDRLNIYLLCGKASTTQGRVTLGDHSAPFAVWPRASSRPPCPREVPPEIAEDYTEACGVLPVSPKASAALSRRCLQNLLREAGAVKHGNLANEIQQILDSGAVPSYIADIVDAVRNIGNFAAHPIKSQTTGEIVPVEPKEAEWNLDVLEALFDFHYVQPATVQRRKAALDRKLRDAGKKPMK